MARISTYGQDSTLNKADKVVGTDSATGATKNYTIESILSVANQDNLVEVFDGAAFEFQNYVDPSGTVNGVLNLNAGSATNTAFSAVTVLYVSVNDKSGNSLREYLENADNDFIKISKTDNLNQFGIYEVTSVADYGNNKYKKLTLTPRGTNGTLTVGTKYFVANYSALYDQDFSDDSVTEFQDVHTAGSGHIITAAERQQLQILNNNALVHNDVVDNVTSTATDVPLSANQGKVLKGLIDSINTLLTSDNTDLDTLQEVVDYIETNRSDLDTLSISNITGLQAALDNKQNTESGKGLSANDFTTILKNKLDDIDEYAQVNVKPNWTAAAGTDSEILNKPADLTNLTLHYVTSLQDVTSAGSGAIITDDERDRIDPTHANFVGLSSAERTKLTSIDVDPTARTVTEGTDVITVPPQNAQANVQADWDETDTASDAFIKNKPNVASKADKATTITVQGTTNEVEVSPAGAQDLSANRTFTIGLPNDVTIGEDLKVNETIELVNTQTSTPTFDNGIYYKTEDSHDTLHFRYHGHDLSIDKLTEVLPSGILNGGKLTKANNTEFTIAAGDGIINDLNKGTNTDPHPEIISVEWSEQTIEVANLDSNNSTQLNSWIYIDSSGTVQQQSSAFTEAQFRTTIPIGSAIHTAGVLQFVRTFPRTAYNTASQHSEFIAAFGPLKKLGHKVTANGTNLSIDRSSGVAFSLGRNYVTDPENPSTVSDGAKTAALIHRYRGDGSGGFVKDTNSGSGYTTLDPTKYDSGSGSLSNVTSGHYSVQRLFYFPGTPDIIISYYATGEYNSMDEAEKNYLLETFTEADNTAQQAIYLGAIIMSGGATDLSNSSQAKILTAGTFRSLAATNLGGVAANSALSDLSDVTITSPSNGQVLKYDSSQQLFVNATDEGGIALTDLSVGAEGTPSGDGSLSYDNTTGVLTYTPPVLLDGTGAANRLAVWSDTDSLTNYNNLRWDSSNERLSVGAGVGNSTIHAYSAGAGNVITAASGSTNARIEFRDINTAQGNSPRIGSQGNDTTFNNGANTEHVRIKSDGKVGIGTTAPATSLDIDATDAIIIPKGTDAQRDALTGEAGMLRFNTTDNEFEGYDGTEWGAIGGSSGGGSANIIKKTFNGGVAAYVLDNTIADIDNVQVFVDGVYQYPSNYTVSGSTVTFVSGSEPASGTDNVHISHFVSPAITEGSVFSTMEDVGDGSTATFALGNTPRDSDHTFVYLNGVYQEKSTYTIAGSDITFSPAVPNGVSIEVRFVTGIVDLTDVGNIVLKEYTGDGSTSTYALGTTPLSEVYVDAYLNGVYQEAGTFSLSGSNIVFDTNVPNGVSIEIKSRSSIESSAISATSIETDTFTGNGSTTSYSLVNGNPTSKSLTMVYIQGVYQAKANYSLTSGAIVFSTAPAQDDAIEVLSISAVNTASPVTSVNGETGAVTVVSKPDVEVISADTNAVVNTVYVFTATLTLTLPASPSLGDSIKISNLSDVSTCVLGRNNNKIMGTAEDLTLDTASASFELIWSGDTKGWVIIGQ